MGLPEGCFSASRVPGGMSIGYERFYDLRMKLPLPTPDGYYAGGPPAKKSFPYWKRETLEMWISEASNQ
jgi:hypothetical protein